MAVLKYFDGSDWEPVVSALQGPTGPTGAASTITGPTGATGPTGSDASSGLVLINTTSFSAVSSVSVNDVFSATYENYKIIVNQQRNTGAGLNQLRFRVAGADNSSNLYIVQVLSANGGSASASSSTSTSASLSAAFTTGANIIGQFEIEMQNPFQSKRTTYLSRCVDGNDLMVLTGQYYNADTSFTGFSIIASANTITGSVSVFGYNV